MTERLLTPLPEQSGVDVFHRSAQVDIAGQIRFARQARNEYMGLYDLDKADPAYLQLLAHGMDRREKVGYHFSAGWAYAETAVLPRGFNSSDREGLVGAALTCWQTAMDMPSIKPEMAARVLLSICQKEALLTLSEAANEGYFHPVIVENQEADYQKFFDYYLNNWHDMGSHGLAYEALSLYFMHRSNALRPREAPILPLFASVREDHHPSPGRRLDATYYDTWTGDKFGAQLKSGKISDDELKQARLRRVLVSDARNLLCIPRTKRKLWNTMRAIADEEEEFALDLDIIGLELRVKLQNYFRDRKRSFGRIPLRHMASATVARPKTRR